MAEPIVITSLRGALESLLDDPAGTRIIRMRSLQVQHAAALEEMLHFDASRPSSMIEEFHKLKAFATADAILLILEDALLLILVDDPTSIPALNLLQQYSDRLHVVSITVGGAFEEEIDLLHEALLRHVQEARAEPVAIPLTELVSGFKSIRTHISPLRDRVVGVGYNISSSSGDDDGDE